MYMHVYIHTYIYAYISGKSQVPIYVTTNYNLYDELKS